MKRRTCSILGFICFLVICVFFLYLSWGDPVLFSYVDPREISQVPSWSLLNPLRSRAPERPAEAFLQALKEGKAKEVLGGVQIDPLEREHIMEREQQFQIRSWRLIIRKDSPYQSLLVYHVTRENFQIDPNCPVSILVKKPLGAGFWQLTFKPYCY